MRMVILKISNNNKNPSLKIQVPQMCFSKGYIFGAPIESTGPGMEQEYLLNSSKAHASRGLDKLPSFLAGFHKLPSQLAGCHKPPNWLAGCHKPLVDWLVVINFKLAFLTSSNPNYAIFVGKKQLTSYVNDPRLKKMDLKQFKNTRQP